MKVGITYDLRDDYIADGYGEEETAEFDSGETIGAIDETLRGLGYETDRIGNVIALTERLAAGDRWDIVFNIAEGLHGIGREAQVPALLDAFRIPYTFSDPLVLALTLHKAMAKRVVRDMGIPTAAFAVIDSPVDIGVCRLSYPLFAKPLSEGTGKGISARSKIRNEEELTKLVNGLLDRYRQPVLVETFLPGREFTVALLGSGAAARVLGVMEVILGASAEADVYSYHNKEHCETLVTYCLPDDAVAGKVGRVALDAWCGLGCRDGGRVDIRMDERGVPNFIEVNPLAGLHPTHSDLPIIASLCGVSYRQLIDEIMISACKRMVPSDHGMVFRCDVPSGRWCGCEADRRYRL